MIDAIFYVGNGGWGNSCYFLEEGKTDRIYGWKPKRFSHAIFIDLCHHLDEGVPLYESTGIEWCDDPRDMFFADVKLIGTISNDVARRGGLDAQEAILKVYKDQPRVGFFKRLFKRRRK